MNTTHPLHNKFIFQAILLAATLYSCIPDPTKEENVLYDYAKYVDPMIGTGGHGHTYPGVSLPFGMVQVSPDNGKNGWDWCSGYHYSSDSLHGISHTHLSGTGIGDMLDISVLPTTLPVHLQQTDSPGFDLNRYFVTFSHQNEIAEAGYYSVRFNETEILAELTGSYRAAFHRYTFPANTDTATLLVNLKFHKNWDQPIDTHIKMISDTLLSGFRYSEGWAKNQKVFFALRTSLPILSFSGAPSDSLFIGESHTIQGPAITGILKFHMAQNHQLMIKVSLSSVSEENALINLNEEIPHWDFGMCRTEARNTWNRELGKIVAQGGEEKDLKIFYTALYHSMLTPSMISDVIDQYRGPDDLIHTDTSMINYHTFSLWDTYRAAHPLMTLLHPEKVAHMVNSMLAFYRESGRLPVWTLWGNETNTMIGYHSIPVITDAFFKGLIPDINPDSVYKAMTASSLQPDRSTPSYITHGYVPAEVTEGSVSITLEYAYDDWCIAQLARELGKEADFQYYMKRAGNYRNLFDPVSGFMRPKYTDGRWKQPFDPFYAGFENDYVEGNAWQYTWYVPHDVPEFIRLMGGNEKFTAKLDSLFSIQTPGEQKMVSDVTGLIGQYAHGNEPSHHIPYLYNYAGKSWKTQEMVDRIKKTMYSDQPDGLCGNEDCGQMSAWYIFSAMGFYPVNPANGRYDLGAPSFSRIEITLSPFKKFTILADHFSPENKYVKSIRLDNKPYTDLFITHDMIMNGGELTFEMTNEPVK